MLKMRLQRVGRKHEPSFRIVLTDSKNSTKSGRFKEILGSYDPRKSTDLLKTDRIQYWLTKGAKVTGTVHNLFVNHGVLTGKKINVLPKKTPIVKEVVAEPVAPVVETPVEVSAPDEPNAPVAETPAAEAIPDIQAEEVSTPAESESTEAPTESTEIPVEAETPESSTPAAPEEPKSE